MDEKAKKAKYKNIPVDEETYKMLVALCATYGRKQGAQVKQMVKVEFDRLQQAKAMVAQVLPKIKERKAREKAAQPVAA